MERRGDSTQNSGRAGVNGNIQVFGDECCEVQSEMSGSYACGSYGCAATIGEEPFYHIACVGKCLKLTSLLFISSLLCNSIVALPALSGVLVIVLKCEPSYCADRLAADAAQLQISPHKHSYIIRMSLSYLSNSVSVRLVRRF